MFIAVSYPDSVRAAIFKWKDDKFEKFQEIGNLNAKASTAFVINNDTFIAFANYYSSQERYSVQSPVFKWSGGIFVPLQYLQTYGAWDVKSFTNNSDTFLAFANYFNGSKHNIDSYIYKWDGSQFVLFQSIPTHGAHALQSFVMYDQKFLVVANFKDDTQGYNTQSVVYQASGERFTKHQEISTHGAFDLTTFEYKGQTYLAIASYNSNEQRNINSTLYKWI